MRRRRSPCLSLAAIRRALTRLLREADGSEAIEFAIVANALLLFLLGTVEFGRLYWTQLSCNTPPKRRRVLPRPIPLTTRAPPRRRYRPPLRLRRRQRLQPLGDAHLRPHGVQRDGNPTRTELRQPDQRQLPVFIHRDGSVPIQHHTNRDSLLPGVMRKWRQPQRWTFRAAPPLQPSSRQRRIALFGTLNIAMVLWTLGSLHYAAETAAQFRSPARRRDVVTRVTASYTYSLVE